MAEFQLFSTLGCHLCEDAKAILDPLLADVGANYVEEEISENDQWMEAYAIRIPVVRSTRTGEELGWPFDTDVCLNWIKSQL